MYQHIKSYRSHMEMHRGRTRCFVCQRVFDRPTRLNEHLHFVHGVPGVYSPRPRTLRLVATPEGHGLDGPLRWRAFPPGSL